MSALVAYLIGHSRGRTDKLDELHELQEEGWLSITYNGDPSGGDANPSKPRSSEAPKAITNGAPQDPRAIIDLMFKDEPKVTRSRRDDDERRVDWAKHVRAQARHRDAQSVDDDDE